MPAPHSRSERSELARRYAAVRGQTEALCAPLEIEDYVVQSMPDASPAKWHLAHTSWFFETLVLKPGLEGYETLDPSYAYLFNSYYNSLGEQFTRADRGLVSRPTVAQVQAYRRHVDQAMARFLEQASDDAVAEAEPVIEVGLHHEQQHQELLLTDVKHLFSRNPLAPVYRAASDATAPDGASAAEVAPLRWHRYTEGLYSIGHEGADEAFAYDNEGPRHRVFLEEFELASRLVTCGEWLDFMADGGYERAELWLSDGWATVQAEGWRAPLYWVADDASDDAEGWRCFTLAGMQQVRLSEPVCHVSFYEADAFARWVSLRTTGVRLPRESEWEVAACAAGAEAMTHDVALGTFVDDAAYRPRPLDPRASGDRPAQLFGDVWEWTASPYVAYPGYSPPPGALGEYNAKFMSNQLVLRGGSCATPRSHIRATYRNFFPAPVRWQMTGLRLARDAHTGDR
ncbi:MAG: ergothioneine biosynthesis protein EgtB [Acidobacteriota bacterium]